MAVRVPSSRSLRTRWLETNDHSPSAKFRIKGADCCG